LSGVGLPPVAAFFDGVVNDHFNEVVLDLNGDIATNCGSTTRSCAADIGRNAPNACRS